MSELWPIIYGPILIKTMLLSLIIQILLSMILFYTVECQSLGTFGLFDKRSRAITLGSMNYKNNWNGGKFKYNSDLANKFINRVIAAKES